MIYMYSSFSLIEKQVMHIYAKFGEVPVCSMCKFQNWWNSYVRQQKSHLWVLAAIFVGWTSSSVFPLCMCTEAKDDRVLGHWEYFRALFLVHKHFVLCLVLALLSYCWCIFFLPKMKKKKREKVKKAFQTVILMLFIKKKL